MSLAFCAVRLFLCTYIVIHGTSLINHMGGRTCLTKRLACVSITAAAFTDLVLVASAVSCGQLATLIDVPKTLTLVGAALLLGRVTTASCNWENNYADRRKKSLS